MLSQFNLEDLINSTIPSPADDDSSYDRWRRLSKKVGDWLKLQIHPSIVAELRFSPDPIVYTDEIYKATTKIVVGRDAVFTWRSAIFMKREDYRTVEQYVIPFRQAVQAANRLHAPISPFCASTLLLEELKKEFPSLTDSIEVRFFFRYDIVETMTEKEFHKICRAALDKCRDHEHRHASSRLFPLRSTNMKEAITLPGPLVRIVDSPIPEPNDDQIFIRVFILGLNPKHWTAIDLDILPPDLPSKIRPEMYQGDDIAGVVERLGKNVVEFKVSTQR